jgi:divalent metal cation (Fe/Co/Zn/Cd) transporter
MNDHQHKLYKQAFALAIFTIIYNVAEGMISIFFGITDESLTLFGFGADSLIEVISGIGIAHMVIRIRRSGSESRSEFEKQALRITGFAFYVLVAVLLLTAGYNAFTGHKPETTIWGVIISLLSIATMMILIRMKTRVGKKLNSSAIIADAQCTRVCVYMSVVLLVSSIIYELTGFGWIDVIGTLGLAWFSFSEGRECFEKIRNDSHCGCSGSCKEKL